MPLHAHTIGREARQIDDAADDLDVALRPRLGEGVVQPQLRAPARLGKGQQGNG